MEEFHAFVERYASAMPEEYPARCNAFASHFHDQFEAFLNGEEVIFPQSSESDDIPQTPDGSETGYETETA